VAKVRGHSARASLLFTENRIACTLLPKGASLIREQFNRNRDFQLEDQSNQRRSDEERNGAARRSVGKHFADAGGEGNCWRLFPQCLRGHSPREQGRYLQKDGN
jgi:hypothetical protein